MLLIRWVTWYPIPYWNDRFALLAKRKDVELEIYFLKAGVTLYEFSQTALDFHHVIVNPKSDSSGFTIQLEWPKPWPLVKGKFDALVLIHANANCIAAALLCLLKRKPYFIFVANTRYDMRGTGKVKEYLKRFLFQHARGILATGQAQKDYALQYTSDIKKISVIGNPSMYMGDLTGKLLGNRQNLRQQFNWEKQVVLLYVGRLSKEKGILTLLEALDKNYQEGIRPLLVLAGTGPLLETLRQEALRLNLAQQIKFAGFLQREELAEYYAAADIFVLPSLSEPWGLVVNEAMEFGLPLILSDHIGCAPELLQEGKNGMSFPSGNSEKLASCIKALCYDRKLRRKMGKISQNIIQNHSIEKWVQNVVESIKNSLIRVK
ncbi:glycosyl transferase group 1 [Candidatus Thiomargarita nelsonii]|uniref:Glycosyl transferase group 1 n=1 Tax=Candidatus Thiomargarita nelsonii TaxID=1003181 RepID=A0A176S5M9_9GAMM|nr:glycosyl transferase group 1 [Candidatus Thiomargarita nelsonii]